MRWQGRDSALAYSRYRVKSRLSFILRFLLIIGFTFLRANIDFEPVRTVDLANGVLDSIVIATDGDGLAEELLCDCLIHFDCDHTFRNIGMDTCYTCWLEECLTTNCLGCKRGNYPDCKWIDLKKSYQEEDK